MKPTPLLFFALFALLWAGCATNDISARIREKSAVYEPLTPEQKDKIKLGVVALGFSSDMVYMAMGHPSTIEPVEKTDGRAEMWIYHNYYPHLDAAHLKRADYRTESPYQPGRTYGGTNVPLGASRTPVGTTTGGPQGTSAEPADLPVFTLRILMQDGKVKRLGIAPE